MAEFNFRVISSKKLLDNLSIFQEKKVCAMVKANAYGFGVKEIVGLVKPYVEYFGVANIEEGVLVRELAPETKVLIVGKNYNPSLACEKKISYAVSSVTEALYVLKGAQVHIKIDSGMHRLGFRDEKEMLAAIEILQEKEANIEGVFTHFSTLDCDHEFFEQQLKNFRRMLSIFPKDIAPLIHVGGSWALGKNIPEADMIRIGKGLYHGAIRIESRLIRVFDIEGGDRVGYANGFIANRKMRIGIVPVGYADGLKRCLANRYHVLIDDKPCKLVGNVCMDMFAVDVTHVKAFEGMCVVIMQDESVMAKKLKTSSYEAVTNFNHLRGKTRIE